MKKIEKIKELYKEIDSLRQEDLEEIKKELEPHFENLGGLYIENECIRFQSCATLKRYPIVSTYANKYNNDYNGVYLETGINKEDIFEEVGDSVHSIKIKPYKPFNIETWKKEFADKYNLTYEKYDKIVRFNGNIVINRFNDINFKDWHSGILSHDVIGLDAETRVYLKTEEDCLESEKIVENYLKKEK